MDATSAIELDSILHQPVRTRIAAFLVARGEATFSDLKKEMQVTDGNLDAHLKKLVAAGYVKTNKQTGQGRPQTTYRLTRPGQSAFENYLEALKRLLSLRF